MMDGGFTQSLPDPWVTELVLMIDNKDIILQNAKEANLRPV